MKIQYKLATKAQASALFLRFFARMPATSTSLDAASEKHDQEPLLSINDLAVQFTSQIPDHEFSTAELQGFLLSCKKEPKRAVEEVAEWVARELKERREKEAREDEQKTKAKEKKEEQERRQIEGAVAKFGGMVGEGFGKIIGGGGGMVTGGGGGGGMVTRSGGGMVTGSGVVEATSAASPDVMSHPPTPSPAYEEKKEAI